MGFWSGLFNPISSFSAVVGEDDPSYKKYVAEIRDFELDPKRVKDAISSQKENFQLNQMQDTLDDIDSIDNVKKHFQDK